MKKTKLFVVKVMVSISLLIYVLAKVGWDNIWAQLKTANTYWITLYVILGFAATLISAIKWHVLAKSHDLPVKLPRLFGLYMVGYFFNQFLPSNVGGDVVRAYELSKEDDNKAAAWASVFMERFIGISTLILLALLAVAIDRRYLKEPVLVTALAVMILGYFGVIGAVFSRSLVGFLERVVPSAVAGKLLTKAGKIQDAIHYYRGHRADLVYAAVYSVLFYGVSVLIVWVGCLALNVRPPVTGLLTAVPVMLLVFALPISVGGIGLHEWAYFFVLAQIGIPGALGVSLGLLYRARTLFFAALGGVIYPLLGAATAETARELEGSVP